ncbi:hypothetical protein QF035_008362 [Streptomyces umbrinus]|uniref:Uncharacterized protein n=1 Tax=Streptomyces umbrinus TaxID=67370 RepID=A0ABU0T4N9_9ACTN|nr:hypothetical protein [Streptomyces umbrinus]
MILASRPWARVSRSGRRPRLPGEGVSLRSCDGRRVWAPLRSRPAMFPRAGRPTAVILKWMPAGYSRAQWTPDRSPPRPSHRELPTPGAPTQATPPPHARPPLLTSRPTPSPIRGAGNCATGHNEPAPESPHKPPSPEQHACSSPPAHANTSHPHQPASRTPRHQPASRTPRHQHPRRSPPPTPTPDSHHPTNSPPPTFTPPPPESSPPNPVRPPDQPRPTCTLAQHSRPTPRHITPVQAVAPATPFTPIPVRIIDAR